MPFLFFGPPQTVSTCYRVIVLKTLFRPGSWDLRLVQGSRPYICIGGLFPKSLNAKSRSVPGKHPGFFVAGGGCAWGVGLLGGGVWPQLGGGLGGGWLGATLLGVARAPKFWRVHQPVSYGGRFFFCFRGWRLFFWGVFFFVGWRGTVRTVFFLCGGFFWFVFFGWVPPGGCFFRQQIPWPSQ